MEMERDNRAEQDILPGGAVVESHVNTVLQTEADLSERDETDHPEEEYEHTDYSQYTKDQFVSLIKELVKENDPKKSDRVLREIKPLFDELRERDRTSALNRFILDGGSTDDFEYRQDELTQQFEASFKLIKDRKAQYQRGLDDQKNENYRKKSELLERLRELVDSQDATNQFNVFKDLQKDWRNTGPVPGTQARTLWANYHALVDRFYDNQSIYFELKELDRKKNLEAKVELCIRAEKLSGVERIKDAIRELNELHHEFKHIGPVPGDEKETVWQRFKTASDAVYSRRDEYLKVLQQELNANVEKKNKLCDEVAVFASFQSNRIKEWNQKTKEVLELQKKWDGIGGLPRAKSKEINKKFWSAFKSFFSNKSSFFKKLDEEREQNLNKKKELVQRALALKDSHEWEQAARDLKNIQQQWKTIGPVPEKFREKVFKEFKEACDYFFGQKRDQQSKADSEQVENLKLKEEICATLENHVVQNTATREVLKELESRFNLVGFVPRKEMNAIRNRYHDAVQKFTNAIQGITEEDKSRLVLENQLLDLKNDPMAGQKLFQKEQAIRKKIQKVENDIAVWRNNLEFFGRSKNAEKYKEEFNDKINTATDSLKQLKEQLKLVRTVS